MKRTNCIIIEDQAPAQRILESYIKNSEDLDLINIFSDAIEARKFLNQEMVDLIFLDIHLPKISGIDFLKTLDNPPFVILTTAFSEYAVQSYELDVVDYLVKPFSKSRFDKAILRMKENLVQKQNENGHSFFIKSGYDYIKVNSNDILFIQTDMDYTAVHLSDKSYLTNETLSYWEGQLDSLGFCRIHRSHLVNTEKIIRISGNLIYMEDGRSLPLGRTFKDDFLSKFVKQG